MCAKQDLENRELLGVERQGPSGPGGDPAGRVERDVATGEERRQGRARPTGQRADAGDQFGEIAWLRQVVIGAEAKAVDPVLDRARRGEHQHPAWRSPGRDPPAHVIAVHAGDVPVQDDHVVFVTAACSSASAPSKTTSTAIPACRSPAASAIASLA
jgi:hypothetical protein